MSLSTHPAHINPTSNPFGAHTPHLHTLWTLKYQYQFPPYFMCMTKKESLCIYVFGETIIIP